MGRQFEWQRKEAARQQWQQEAEQRLARIDNKKSPLEKEDATVMKTQKFAWTREGQKSFEWRKIYHALIGGVGGMPDGGLFTEAVISPTSMRMYTDHRVMGAIVLPGVSHVSLMAKFLVVLALVAAAYAEPEAEANADPAYWYGNYYGLPSYYGGWGYSGYASPYWGGYYNRGYGYWKRDAEAKPEANADPAYWYGNYYGLPSYYGGWGYSGYASPYWGGYYNRGYGYWKRDAEA